MKSYNTSFIAFRSFCIGFLSLLLVSTAHAQWTQADGLYGGEVLSLTSSGTTIFAGTNRGGVFRAIDIANKWIAAGLATHQVNALAVSGTTLFAGTFEKGVYRSSDNGENWTSTGLKNQTVFSLAVSGSTIFAGTYGGGVYRSSDNGGIWTQVNMGLKNKTVYALAVNGSSLYAGTDGGGVFRSTDNAENWTEVNTGLTGKTIKSFAFTGTTLFAGINNGGVYKTNDNGENWIGSGLQNTTVWALSELGTKLIAGTSNGAYSSSDQGGTWVKVDTAELPNKPVRVLTVNGPAIYAGIYGDRGLYRSTDSGEKWISMGLPNEVVSGTVSIGAKVFLGSSTGVCYTTDHGETFHDAGTFKFGVSALEAKDAMLFAGSWDGGLYSSKDEGKTWDYVGLRNQTISKISAFGTVIAVRTNSGSIFTSIDNGITWSEDYRGMSDKFVIDFETINSTFFAVTLNKIYSRNGIGSEWSTVNTGLSDMYYAVLFGDFSALYLATEFSGVFRCTEIGEKCTPTGLKSNNVRAFAAHGKSLFAGTISDGIFLSNDNGANWRNIGLKDQNVSSLSVRGTSLLAGTNGTGVWKFDLNSLSTENEITQISPQFACYPNPATNTLTIDCTSPLFKSANTIHYTISTLTGEKLSEFEKDESRFSIPLGAMANGVYYLIARQGVMRSAKLFTVIQ